MADYSWLPQGIRTAFGLDQPNAALVGGDPSAAAGVVAPGVAPPPALIQQQQAAGFDPHASSYADMLLKEAMSDKPVRSTIEGIGRGAQLVSGWYGQRRAEDQQRKERDDLAGQYDDPRLKALIRSGQFNSEGLRTQLAQGAIKEGTEKRAQATSAAAYQAYQAAVERDTAAGMHPTQAQLKNIGLLPANVQDDRFKGLQTEEGERRAAQRMSGLGEGSGDLADLRKRIYETKDPALIREMIKQDFHKAAERSATKDKIDALVASGLYTREQASAIVGANVPFDQLPGAAPLGKYADSWQSGRTAKERDIGLAAAGRTHDRNEKAIEDAAQGAVRQQRLLMVSEDAINSGVRTGAFQGGYNLLKKMAYGAGLNPANMKESEILDALGNLMVPSVRGGGQLPGAVSNYEMKAYLQSVVSGNNTQPGNRAILDLMRDLSNEPLAVRQDMHDFLDMQRASKNGTMFLAEGWSKFKKERELERLEAREIKLQELRAQHNLDRFGNPMGRQEALERRGSTPAAQPTLRGTVPADERTYSPEEAGRLPSGTKFKGQDGNFYRVP